MSLKSFIGLSVLIHILGATALYFYYNPIRIPPQPVQPLDTLSDSSSELMEHEDEGWGLPPLVSSDEKPLAKPAQALLAEEKPVRKKDNFLKARKSLKPKKTSPPLRAQKKAVKPRPVSKTKQKASSAKSSSSPSKDKLPLVELREESKASASPSAPALQTKPAEKALPPPLTDGGRQESSPSNKGPVAASPVAASTTVSSAAVSPVTSSPATSPVVSSKADPSSETAKEIGRADVTPPVSAANVPDQAALKQGSLKGQMVSQPALSQLSSETEDKLPVDIEDMEEVEEEEEEEEESPAEKTQAEKRQEKENRQENPAAKSPNPSLAKEAGPPPQAISANGAEEGAASAPPPSDSIRSFHNLKQKIGNPPFTYPEFARRKGMQGTVSVLFSVTEQGLVDVIELESSSGHFELDNFVLRTIARYEFLPNQAGRVRYKVPFVLEGEEIERLRLRER